jgi:small subunit ribosomal protein S35
VIRSISYGGEAHPVMRKRIVVTPVSRLPLKNEAAIHKFKLLAGVRWTPDPPKDSGIGKTEEEYAEHGYIKISCEDFPEPAMNLKWASDTLDRLIEMANVSGQLISPNSNSQTTI